MDKKTLLVLGSVTAAQYNDARLKMMREGVDPQVVREEPSSFLLDDLKLIEKYVDSFEAHENVSSMSDKERERLIDKIVAEHLQSFDHPIGAIIMDSPTWEVWDDGEFIDLRSALPVDRWVVRADGRVEYVA